MRKVLLDENKNKYKANLHCHTNVSDGRHTPEEIKDIYKNHGYSIVAYTDHDILIPHDDLNDDSFLALHGYEMEFTGERRNDESHPTCHMCLIQRDPDNLKQVCWHREKYVCIGNASKYKDQIQFDENEPDFERDHTPEVISKAMQLGRENGFFVTYNHPTWSMENFNDYMSFHGMHAMEMCNYACSIDGYEEYNPRVYDDMLRGGERIYCIDADDNHNWSADDSPEFDSCGAFTVIFAEDLSYKSVMDSLFDGKFYASQGPEIFSLSYDEEKIYIKFSPAKRVYLSTNGRRLQWRYSTDTPLTEAVFDIPRESTYFRITVEDYTGKHANTNAYFLDEI